MTSTTDTRTCPSCGRGDRLATIETIQALAAVRVGANGSVEFEGDTDVAWDTSMTVGVSCRACGWEHEGEDWLQQLR